MTYYPSDCPNTPRVFEPDALSFRGGGGSGVERGVFTAPLNFWNSNVATHRFSVFTLYSQGERRGWPWRRRGHGPRTGSRKVHESNGWDRAEAIFYVQNESILCGASVRKKARKRLRRPSTSQDNRRPFRGT